MSALAEIERVRGRLGGIRLKIRTLFFIDGLARILLALLAFFLLTFALDYFLNLPRQVRFVFFLSGVVWISYLVVRKIVYRLAVPIDDDDLALLIERHNPELRDRLISAIQFSRRRDDDDPSNSPELVDRLIEDAAQASASLNFAGILLRAGVAKIAAVTLLIWGLLAASVTLCPAIRPRFNEYFPIYIQRLIGLDVRWPRMIRVEVLDFGEDRRRAVARGDDLTVVARVHLVRPEASVPAEARLYYAFDSGVRDKKEGWRKGDEFHFKIESVNSKLTFHIEAGDDRTDEYTVDIVNPPGLEEIHLFYTYPRYLRMPDTPTDRPEINGNVNAPMHSRVAFVARSTEELQEARLVIEEQTIDLPLEADAEGIQRKVRGEFEVRWPKAQYQLVFVAKNGLSNEERDPIRFVIKGKIDTSPELTVVDPVGNEEISELCVRPLELDVKDDFGIQEIGMEVKVSGSKEIDWTYAAFTKQDNGGEDYGARQIRTNYSPGLDVTKLGVKPGDYVHVRFRASDFKDIGQRNITVSKEYRFEVIPLTELQKKLEREIESVKSELESVRGQQERLYDEVERFRREGMADKDLLETREAGQIRNTSLEQNRVTSRLQGSERAIARVRRRGVYNKVFEEEHTRELVQTEEILSGLAGTPDRPGASPVAASHLQEGSKVRTRGDRRTSFREAQGMQTMILQGIDSVIRLLQRWSTYQEIIRKAREIWQRQHDLNEKLKGPGRKDN